MHLRESHLICAPLLSKIEKRAVQLYHPVEFGPASRTGARPCRRPLHLRRRRGPRSGRSLTPLPHLSLLRLCRAQKRRRQLRRRAQRRRRRPLQRRRAVPRRRSHQHRVVARRKRSRRLKRLRRGCLRSKSPRRWLPCASTSRAARPHCWTMRPAPLCTCRLRSTRRSPAPPT